MQKILVDGMVRIKIVIAVILIGVISFTAYMYFGKQPVKSAPDRATFVLNQQNFVEKEGVEA